jgi:hypothetical protein
LSEADDAIAKVSTKSTSFLADEGASGRSIGASIEDLAAMDAPELNS